MAARGMLVGMTSLKNTLLMLGLAAWVAHAENWPQFRGPDGQGHSKESSVPTTWSATDHLAWKTEIPGEAWSSPIVHGNRVFVTTTTDNGESCRIIGLERKTGRIVWNTEVFRQVPRRKETRNSYATPTPATDGRRVYACFGDGSFAAVDFDGKPLWINREHPFYSQHGLGTALVLHDGLLIMSRDASSEGADKKVGWQIPWEKSYVVALDAKTGKQQWRTGRGRSRISHGTPVLWSDPTGRRQLVTEAGDVLQGFDLKSGTLLWTSDVPGEGKVPSVVIGGGMAFCSGGWGGKDGIKAFRLGGEGSLKQSNLVWEQKRGEPKVPSLIHLDGLVYAMTDTGMATCYEASTGAIVWQERVGGNFSASPVSAAGRIYFVGDNGQTTVLDASKTFRVVARNPLVEGEEVQASPAISQGLFLLRTRRTLWAFKK
jgi:outer membrane protein assembly factor BamB